MTMATLIKESICLAVVVHTFNPNTQKQEAGRHGRGEHGRGEVAEGYI